MRLYHHSIKLKFWVGDWLLLFLCLNLLAAPLVMSAEETVIKPPVNPQYLKIINANEATAPVDLAAFESHLTVFFATSSLSAGEEIELTELKEEIPLPWQLDKASAVYQIDIKNKALLNNNAYTVKINYPPNNNFKKIFFFDKNCSCWRPLTTQDNLWRNTATAKLNFSFVRLAVFSYPNVLMVGKASWYNYKKGNYAASPDWPKGTKLRVINKNNNKFVDVEVNDYGPDQSIHPDRVIDLEKTAFKKIAATGDGTTAVVIVPLSLPAKTADLFGVSDKGAETEISVSSKSALLFNEKNGEIIWKKNATSTLPLASLTKMIAVKTFLDTRPSLNQVVAYKEQDEKYNYQYCKPGESARLRITDGETLTIADLIYTSLVGSANNTVESLVRVSGLTRVEFIAKMNENVVAWGASTTKFIEPTGLAPENVSSALDYAIITKEVLTNPLIFKASTMPEYKFTTISSKKFHRIKNTNSLLLQNKYQIAGTKTGYLDEAGYCLMTRIKNTNGYFIVVTLGASTKAASYADTENLIKYGFKKL